MDVASWFRSKKTESNAPTEEERRPHVIVLGNEKGGSGKTTTCMHIIVALLRLGFKVGSIDIDARQRSLSRYIENRRKLMAKESTPLPTSHHIVITKSPFNVKEEAEEDERERFEQGLKRVFSSDFVVIDSPGNDTFLSRLVHSYADTVITPINDSFVDLDVLASIDPDTMKVVRPSIYSEMVWEQKLARAKRDGGSLEWIVMRNRLSTLDARNKRFMKKAVEELARRIGFRLAPGFSERVIYREMFLQGLTVLDVMDMSESKSISMSHIAARQEVRELLKMLRIPEVDRRINDMRKKENPEAEEDEKPAAEETKTDAPKPKEETSKADDAPPQPNKDTSAAAPNPYAATAGAASN